RKRPLGMGERESVPRLTDLHAVLASMAGKIELEYAGEDKKEEDLVDRLINRAVLAVWDRFLSVEAPGRIVGHFEAGWGVEVSDRRPSAEDRGGVQKIPALRPPVAPLPPFQHP